MEFPDYDNASPSGSMRSTKSSKIDVHATVKTTKITKVLEACRAKDVAELVNHASTRFGLVDDKARREAWPILLGCMGSIQPASTALETRHRDEDQVKLDVDRSFVYYPNEESKTGTDERRSQLNDLITTTLRQFPFLNYFQGYHDIVQVLLLALGPDAAREPIARLSVLRIRDFMLPSIQGAVKHLDVLRAIMLCADKQLASHLAGTQPFYALAATITLYAHEIQEYGDIGRLFDFFLAHEAVMPQYFFAVTILARRKELLEYDAEDVDILHSILSRLPRPLDIEQLIDDTLALYDKHPPENLPNRAWQRMPVHSVLRTTHIYGELQTQSLEQGRVWFEKQSRQLDNERLIGDARRVLWQYRRPGGVAAAVAVAVLSYWLRGGSVVGLAYACIGRLRDVMALFR